MHQKSLFPAPLIVHGGELVPGRRKSRRPLARKAPIHLTLKARRSYLLEFEDEILTLARRFAEKYGVVLYDAAVNRDHLHFILRIPSREAYNRFIRVFTGALARKLEKGLWLLRPFTRIGAWGRDFRNMRRYLRKNRDEARGLRPYTPRKDYYRTLRPRPGRPAVSMRLSCASSG